MYKLANADEHVQFTQRLLRAGLAMPNHAVISSCAAIVHGGAADIDRHSLTPNNLKGTFQRSGILHSLWELRRGGTAQVVSFRQGLVVRLDEYQKYLENPKWIRLIRRVETEWNNVESPAGRVDVPRRITARKFDSRKPMEYVADIEWKFDDSIADELFATPVEEMLRLEEGLRERMLFENDLESALGD